MEDFDPNNVFLEIAAASRNGLAHSEAEEVPMSRRMREYLAQKDFLQFELDGFNRKTAIRVRNVFNGRRGRLPCRKPWICHDFSAIAYFSVDS